MQIVWPEPNRRFGFADALGIVGASGLLAARLFPFSSLPFWSCALRAKTGWPCPGCGLTRAAERVARGDLFYAIEANPLGALAMVFLALLAGWSFLHLAFKVPIPQVRLSPKEGLWARLGAGGALLFNYAFLVLQSRLGGAL
jgi:hypothetical protein